MWEEIKRKFTKNEKNKGSKTEKNIKRGIENLTRKIRSTNGLLIPNNYQTSEYNYDVLLKEIGDSLLQIKNNEQ